MSSPLRISKAEETPGEGNTPTPTGDVLPFVDAVKRSGIQAPRPAVVLVVDDDASVLIASRRILAKYGYTVLEAPGGEEALQIARENAARIDVVLTDVRMPGLDGPALVRKLADVLPILRVVYMSGYTDGRLDQELPAPGRAFLAKPFTVEQLTRTLASILEG
jgi:two-component system cell cycle sensor histidine kinase/response regulator CckA